MRAMSSGVRERKASIGGVLASLGASALFGVTFVLPPLLQPLGPSQILAYRIVVTLLFLALLHLGMKTWDDVAAIIRRCRRHPRLVPVVAADAALLGLQLWLFGWAPATGHGLELSLGYLILPLVMVVVGVVFYREKMSIFRALAVVCAGAGAGVGAALMFAHGVGWATALVALGFPPYFMIRRRFRLDSPGAQFVELVAMLPFTIVIWTVQPSFDLLTQQPSLLLGLVLLGLVSAAGFTLYLTASRTLPFALFGVLGYVEPILLVAISLTWLGEQWSAEDAATYLPITAGLVLLLVEALYVTRSRGRTAAGPGELDRARAADGS